MYSKLACLVLAIVTSFPLCAAAQHTINKFDLLTGYSHLSSPSVNLEQNGFNTSFGVNANRWLALGADFSIFKGDGSIALKDTKIAGTLAPFLPAGANPSVPFGAKTYTVAAGPQINFRHFRKVMFFARPGLGLLHERADLRVAPELQPLLPLIPSIKTKMNDTVLFYGLGGGFDVNASEQFGLRFSVDFVRTPLFSSLLESRNAIRFTVGPTFKWGSLR